MEKVSTDVLIIGGGLAAMMAALEAFAFTSSVLMVSKGKIGRSGATLWAGANLAAVLPDAVEGGDSIDFHVEDTFSGGGCINDLKLIRVLAENAPGDLLLLEKLGVSFLKRNGRFDLRQPPGHRNPRTVFTLNPNVPMKIRGKTITDPLRQAVLAKDITTVEGVSIIRLITEDGRIAGAIGLLRKSGEIIAIECKAAVIASGGAGSLYEVNTNPNDLTGDSYALGLEAGCSLRDMEFVQFFPCFHLGSPRITIHTPLFSDGAVLRNKEGERFLAKYDAERMELGTRDAIAQAIYREIEEGSGIDGGVYADLTGIPSELISFRFPDLLRLFRKHGIDLEREWIRVAPAAHFFMGGVVIDERCRTSIHGLFAAGEATGGVHGANRLSGNGLSDPLVFGRIAGREAALYAEDTKKIRASQDVVSIASACKGEGMERGKITEIRDRIRQLMTHKVGIIRKGTGLEEASGELGSLRGLFDLKGPAGEKAMGDYFEVRSMLIAALAVARSALFREESRGAHMREDFPTNKPEMVRSICVRLDNGEIKPSFQS
jgi:fumarate reductase (CoM/CoB) subunit A